MKLAEEREFKQRIIVNGLMPLRRSATKSVFTCKQVSHIMRCFPDDAAGIEDARVQALQSCFARIADLHNIFPHILQDENLLSKKMSDLCIERLGWLNVFNPGNPDLIYDLDMSIWEHYQITLMLVELADVEPGENFLDETWTKWDKQAKTEYIPGEKGDYVLVDGWELPMSWVENGPPDRGFLHVEYYSGRDKETGELAGLEGCAPVWKLRESMMENVLLGTYGERRLRGI